MKENDDSTGIMEEKSDKEDVMEIWLRREKKK